MDLEAFGARLRELADADRFSGVVAVEQAGERVFTVGYGFASRAWGVPNTPGIRFDTASITKLFTAVAVLQLIQDGQFALDTPVVGYLGLTGTKVSPEVTPYHLLTHTSGIADDADEEAGERYEDLFLERPNYSISTTAELFELSAHRDPNFPPGQSTRYCNAGFVLLGLMVEKATGVPYRDQVTRRVFAPAGMDDSGFFRMDVVAPRVAEGADPITDDEGHTIGWKRNIYSYPPVGDPAGGAYVTAGDLLSFHRALRQGRLLGPEFTEAMLSPKVDYQDHAEGKYRVGFGMEFIVDPAGTIKRYWKEGENVGASGILWHRPEDDVTLVVLSNTEDGAWDPVTAFTGPSDDD
jgi:CubicO group peptidase (beta-lactamase class C family)